MDKNLVIITSFGCDKKCPYCISKLHPILSSSKSIEETTVDWIRLEKIIEMSTSETITLSGGGDPFYNWEKNKKFFEKLAEISKRHNKKLEVSTKILPMDQSFIKLFDKINYLVDYNAKEDSLYKLKRISWWFLTAVQVKVTQIVDYNITDHEVYDLIYFLKRLGIREINFKEVFGGVHASKNYESLKRSIEPIEGVEWIENSNDLDNIYYFLIDEKIHDYIIGDSLEERNSWKITYEAFTE